MGHHVDSKLRSRSSSPDSQLPKQVRNNARLAECVISAALDAKLMSSLVMTSKTHDPDGTNTLLWAVLEMQTQWQEKQAYRADVSIHSSVYNALRSTLHTPTERLLWHGAPWMSVIPILHKGFKRARSGCHGSQLGVGTYFTVSPDHAVRFCDDGHPRALFLARVLVGLCTKGRPGLLEPPEVDGQSADSTVDDCDNPQVFCVFRDFQALPVGLVMLG